jgi:hypothetical protein
LLRELLLIFVCQYPMSEFRLEQRQNIRLLCGNCMLETWQLHELPKRRVLRNGRCSDGFRLFLAVGRDNGLDCVLWDNQFSAPADALC